MPFNYNMPVDTVYYSWTVFLEHKLEKSAMAYYPFLSWSKRLQNLI